jgi:hypothetical protein
MEQGEVGRPMAKGDVINHMRAWIDAHPKRAEIRAALAKPYDAMLDGEPFKLDWVDFRQTNAIVSAVYEVLGASGVHEFMRWVTQRGIVPRVRPLIEGTIRLFGVKPEALLSRVEFLNRTTTKNIDARWDRIDDHSGDVVLTFHGPIDGLGPQGLLSLPAQLGWAAALSTVFDLCHVQGRAEPAETRARELRIRCRW